MVVLTEYSNKHHMLTSYMTPNYDLGFRVL